MVKKTYQQYCAIAHALDLIGDRWTLLIARNLLAGPRRFSDLMKGLPGISTNILTDRLKSLDEHNIVVIRELPPPAASTVYQLTPSGYGLAETLGALARWGATTLGAPTTDHRIVAESVLFMLQGVFWKVAMLSGNLTCNIAVEDPHYQHFFSAQLSQEGTVITEHALDMADITLTLALEALLRLSSRQLSLHEAIESGVVRLDGDEALISQFVALIDARLITTS